MAVVIVSNLRPDPRRTGIPGHVTLRQTLISDQTSEKAICEFQLAGGHDIWFELSDGTPSKSVTFQQQVTSENTQVEYPVRLIRDAGSSRLDGAVGIDLTITDEGAVKTMDHCTVVIL